jgi:hypothetical protein
MYVHDTTPDRWVTQPESSNVKLFTTTHTHTMLTLMSTLRLSRRDSNESSKPL